MSSRSDPSAAAAQRGLEALPKGLDGMQTPAGPHPASVLIVDDDLDAGRELGRRLADCGLTVRVSAGGTRLRRALREGRYDVLLADRNAADMDELADLDDPDKRPAVILLAAFGSVHDAVEAMRRGAFDYIEKPASDEQIALSVRRALEQRSLRAENRRLRADLGQRFELGKLLSRDPKMQRVFETVAAVCDTRATLLIEGESGTGKTMLARTIHQNSARATGPFVEVNCGALPESLLESELFGHVRGAFTGAVRDKPGKFEAAHGGTLFLDEIATAPPDLQIKLLRVLQDRVFERVGDTRTRTTDVRVLAASNRRLTDEVRAGRFREDLYYRIKVLSVELPPLRERPSDVVLLAEAFVERFRNEYGRTIERLHADCLPLLAAHTWPGNVRELEHCIERAVLLAKQPEILPQDLGLEPTGAPDAAGSHALEAGAPGPGPGPLKKALEGPEREIIRRALMIQGGNRNATARLLEINRTTLFNKMRKYGLMDLDFGRDPT